MSVRHEIRASLDEARIESGAAVVALVGDGGELLDRAGHLPPAIELRLGLLPVAEWRELLHPQHVRCVELPHALAELPAARAVALLPVFTRLTLLAVTTTATREATLQQVLLRLARDLRVLLQRTKDDRGGGEGGGDEAVAWLSVRDVDRRDR